ncbi:hypothetical protein C8Q80DRAFT_1274867 [Daedaleopsis nitida]|nr:hypothetical protein C8Q80DRAFT_1274867 [Daedaleopsis nitida]
MFMKMRDFVLQHPPRSRHVEDIVEMGRNVVEEKLKWKNYDGALHDRKNKGTKDRRQKETSELLGSGGKREAADKKAPGDAGGVPCCDQDGPLPVSSQGRTVAESLVRLSPVQVCASLKNSTSTKLDYILNEVLLYDVEEKFLLFLERPAILSFIAEALNLVSIWYLEFSGQKKSEYWQTVLTTIETSNLYGVLLLELKYGARGS